MWLDNLIIEGIQRLLILRLKNSPALDTINPLIDTWVYVFKAQLVQWDEMLDTPRIQQAFLHCAGKVDEFPAPKTVLQFLPSRPDQLKLPTNTQYTMPANIKALLAEKIEQASHLTDAQRRALIDSETQTLQQLIRSQK